ncbi:hypothetical protein ACFQ3W_24925 [Paenibacillus puldeungensis]|uniref:Uncharacterized protein n=1 Tax=Paenibacillus puldeungensis TaxID=696536 RepID=A0ABW3S4G9_9BACL
MSNYLESALRKLKRLQNETTNVSVGTAMEQVGWFFKQDFQSVIDDLETHKILLEMKNDRCANSDHQEQN